MDAIKSIGEKLKLGRSKVAARKRKNEEEIAAEKQQIIVQVQQVQQQLPTDADQALVATVQACLVKYQRDDFAGGAVELKAVVASLAVKAKLDANSGVIKRNQEAYAALSVQMMMLLEQNATLTQESQALMQGAGILRGPGDGPAPGGQLQINAATDLSSPPGGEVVGLTRAGDGDGDGPEVLVDTVPHSQWVTTQKKANRHDADKIKRKRDSGQFDHSGAGYFSLANSEPESDAAGGDDATEAQAVQPAPTGGVEATAPPEKKSRLDAFLEKVPPNGAVASHVDAAEVPPDDGPVTSEADSERPGNVLAKAANWEKMWGKKTGET